MYLIVIAAVFGILGISMALSVNKIKDDNIIEALKEDSV
jgi:putative ABC transport system permease protein